MANRVLGEQHHHVKKNSWRCKGINSTINCILSNELMKIGHRSVRGARSIVELMQEKMMEDVRMCMELLRDGFNARR